MLKIPQVQLIVVPDKFLRGFVTDFYLYLIRILREVNPLFQVVSSNVFNPTQNLSDVFVVSLAHWPQEDLSKIKQLPSRTKLYCWYDDVIWTSEAARLANIYLFDRACCIIHSSKYSFLDMWSKYKDKAYWLPFFAAPYIYTKEYAPASINKCLLTGATEQHFYPLRFFVVNSKLPMVEKLEHPGYIPGENNSHLRSNYAKILSSYFCAVTDGGNSYGASCYKITGEKRVFSQPVDLYLQEMMGDRFEQFKSKGQVVLKFFEIPAAGSLLIADVNHCKEMFEIGYRHLENFICVDQSDVLSVIEDCCLNPSKYEHIRRAGWLNAKQHTLEQRRDQLRKILSDVENR